MCASGWIKRRESRHKQRRRQRQLRSGACREHRAPYENDGESNSNARQQQQQQKSTHKTNRHVKIANTVHLMWWILRILFRNWMSQSVKRSTHKTARILQLNRQREKNPNSDTIFHFIRFFTCAFSPTLLSAAWHSSNQAYRFRMQPSDDMRLSLLFLFFSWRDAFTTFNNLWGRCAQLCYHLW